MKEVELLQHQVDFVEDVTTPFLGFVGGYRSGKTFSLCYKALYLASLNEMDGALLEPTYGMITKVLIPTMSEILYELEIPFVLNNLRCGVEHPEYVIPSSLSSSSSSSP